MKDLQDLEITRDYNVSLDRLWSAVTRPEQIAQWLGSVRSARQSV